MFDDKETGSYWALFNVLTGRIEHVGTAPSGFSGVREHITRDNGTITSHSLSFFEEDYNSLILKLSDYVRNSQNEA